MDQSLINSWGGGLWGGGRWEGEAAWASFSFDSGDNIYYYSQHLQPHTPIYCPTDIIQTRIKHKEHFLFSTV